MSKPYPPILEGKVPAFYGNLIKVPVTFNRFENLDNISAFALKFKTISLSADFGTTIILKNTLTDSNELNQVLEFEIPDDLNLNIGQYYKIQIASCIGDYDKNELTYGYWSDIAVVKYTAEPQLTILNFADKNSFSTDRIIGEYINSNDITEKVNTYQFDIYDANGNLHLSSGECLHNSSLDTEDDKSVDEFILTKELSESELYTVYYTITTLNGLTKETSATGRVLLGSINPEYITDIQAKLNPDEGYVELSLTGNSLDNAFTGSFVIKRASEDEDFDNWETIYDFSLRGGAANSWSWKDFTVEFGKTYKYAIQQYHGTVFSNKVKSNSIFIHFEDSFLFDGERQLKIQFNPKVSSLKDTILETKTDTIGHQYPFFYRNGRVDYKQFSISGLVSYLSDPENLFMVDSNEFISNIKEFGLTTNLTNENIVLEKLYRDKVIEWLNDGNPKVFKSPTEGSFIVRLNGVSLTPNDALSRMLYTFTATAFEIADYNSRTLFDLNILKREAIEETTMLGREEIELSAAAGKGNLIKSKKVLSLKIKGATNGTFITINETDYYIGPTGWYEITQDDNINITSIIVSQQDGLTGTLEYIYETQYTTLFDQISNVSINNWEFRQFIGVEGVAWQQWRSIVDTLEERTLPGINLAPGQVLKEKVVELKQIQLYKRRVIKVDNFPANPEPSTIYYIVNDNEEAYRDGNTGQYINQPTFKVMVNNVERGIEKLSPDANTKTKWLDNLDIEDILISDGIICELLYLTKTLSYSLENDDSVVEKKTIYDQQLSNYLSQIQQDDNNYSPTYEDVQVARVNYLNSLNSALNEALGRD